MMHIPAASFCLQATHQVFRRTQEINQDKPHGLINASQAPSKMHRNRLDGETMLPALIDPV